MTALPPQIDLVGSIEDAMMNQNALDGALKTRADLDRYRLIIEETKPDLIIETGTLAGVSALWFAETAEALVITIDVQPQLHATVVAGWADRVRMIYGDSVDADLVAGVRAEAERFERVMVVLDSDHGAGHVYAEMLAYAPLVTPGCFLVVEDTLVRWMPWFKMGDGPLGAVEKYQRYFPGRFGLDLTVEHLSPRTQCPGGWLRRTDAAYDPPDPATCDHGENDPHGNYWHSDLGPRGTWCDRCGYSRPREPGTLIG